MAAYDRYTAIGAREDLTDVIYDISPTDTPIMSSIGKTKATSLACAKVELTLLVIPIILMPNLLAK